MQYTAEQLITEAQGNFTGGLVPPTEYLLSEYTLLVRSLCLLLPGSDAQCTLTPADGKLETDLSPAQIRRVFCGEDELLRGSEALLALLPDAKLYAPTADGIAVSVTEGCTVYYRALPDVSLAAAFPLDARYVPLARAWLCHRAFLYAGDFESADAFGTEYNRLLADFKAENGVTV